MPELELMLWDSQILGLRAGRLEGAVLPAKEVMDSYDMLMARLPADDNARLVQLQAGGFHYVALDFELSAQVLELKQRPLEHAYRFVWRSRQKPDFAIKGFRIDDSRLMRDPRCRSRLPTDFWDKVVHEHCAEYADIVACAIDADNCLLGFISCFVRDKELQLFMVGVHPHHQSKGIGSALLGMAGQKAQENDWTLSTQVLGSNFGAMNFYLAHGFRFVSGHVVLHRWNKLD